MALLEIELGLNKGLYASCSMPPGTMPGDVWTVARKRPASDG